MLYTTHNLKDWMKNKWHSELTSADRYCISTADEKVAKETEKAVLIKFECDFGVKSFWFPKSAFMTIKEIREYAKEKQARMNKACDNYNKALQFAKDNGLNVRNKMKLKTIIAAIRNAGLEFEF